VRAADAGDRARELARESRFLTFCRIGFLGRGVLYILIGFLALGTGRTEDVTGALEYLGHGVGRILLMAIAAGMAAYGLWRLSDAAFGIESPGRDGKALRKRAAAGGIGLIYLALCYKAVRILLVGRAGTMSPREQAHTVLGMPGGTWILGSVALFLFVAGIVQLRKAGKCGFLDALDTRAQAPLAKWLGRIGYAARGVVFLTVAYLFAKAAYEGRSKEAGGMEQALDFLSGPVLWAVALGLMLFGLFSILEAVFRRMSEPPSPGRIKAIVEEKLT
jgi:hypothetical protein